MGSGGNHGVVRIDQRKMDNERARNGGARKKKQINEKAK